MWVCANVEAVEIYRSISFDAGEILSGYPFDA
jgi:hypothetical protein